MFCFGFKPPHHLEAARTLLTRVLHDQIKSTYSNDNILKVNNSVYEVDCSGFLRHILETAGNDEAIAELLHYTVHIKGVVDLERIYTYDLFDFFDEVEKGRIKSKEWKIISSHKSIKAGDILVWLGDTLGSKKQEQSGHVSIVNKVIAVKKDHIHLEIIDSAAHQHFNDSRFPNHTGIGKGEVYLYFDGHKRFAGVKSIQANPVPIQKKVRIARLTG